MVPIVNYATYHELFSCMIGQFRARCRGEGQGGKGMISSICHQNEIMTNKDKICFTCQYVSNQQTIILGKV